MNTAATTTAEIHTLVTVSAKGGPGRSTTYRVAAATAPELLKLNGATREAKAAVAAGQLAIRNGVKGKGYADVVASELADSLR